MGQSHSSHPGRSTADKRYCSLYKELRRKNIESSTEGDVDDTLFKTRFSNYFGGPCVKFGQLLHDRLFNESLPVTEQHFCQSMEKLAKLTGGKGSHHEAEMFFFYVFSQGHEQLDQKSLIEVIYTAGMFGLVVGSELHENAKVPRDNPFISSLVSAAMLVADTQSHELSATQFAVWMNEHCPKLLEGLQHWIETVLHGDHTSTDTDIHTQYELPFPKVDKEEDALDMHLLVWVLSTIIPPVFLGHKRDESAAQSSHKHPIGGTWTSLYSSSRDGLSMNRFTSHSFDYKEPSIMIVTCTGQVNEKIQFVIGVDREWRDGTHYWGDENTFLLELRPSFTLLNKGAKLVSLNEKQRGFPTGLRFMKDTNYKECILVIDYTLNTATYNGSVPLEIQHVEVWGCGGQEAAESQRRLREWEKKEAVRRQKINREDLKEMWEDSPDRYILEMGGVKVNNPKEQQQE